MAKSSKRISSRKPSIFDGIIPEAEGSESSPSKLSEFVKNYYKPIAVVIAIVILVWVSMYIYRGNETEKMKGTVTELKEAKSLEQLNEPNLVAAVKGTKLEFEWHLAVMIQLMTNKLAGAKSIDYEGFIEEADIFIDKYPNKLATLQIMFVQANFYAYIGKVDEAKTILEDIIAHPKAENDYILARAEKELAILKDPTKDPEIDANFIAGLSAFAAERVATPTPTPTPPMPVPTSSVVPTDLNGTVPVTTPAKTDDVKAPKPLDLNEPKPEDVKPEPTKTEEAIPEEPKKP